MYEVKKKGHIISNCEPIGTFCKMIFISHYHMRIERKKNMYKTKNWRIFKDSAGTHRQLSVVQRKRSLQDVFTILYSDFELVKPSEEIAFHRKWIGNWHQFEWKHRAGNNLFEYIRMSGLGALQIVMVSVKCSHNKADKATTIWKLEMSIWILNLESRF